MALHLKPRVLTTGQPGKSLEYNNKFKIPYNLHEDVMVLINLGKDICKVFIKNTDHQNIIAEFHYMQKKNIFFCISVHRKKAKGRCIQIENWFSVD